MSDATFIDADGKVKVRVFMDGGLSVDSDDISDATTVGKAVLTAADEATARAAIGANGPDKTEIAALMALEDPSTATTEEIATAVNAIIAALQA